jgi:hypothetical protein
MSKFIILISMSLCTFAEAQKAFEWQIKLGLYKDIHSMPPSGDDGNGDWQRLGPKVFTTISVGIELKKWRTLIQLNADTRLTFWGDNIKWLSNWNYPITTTNIPNPTNNVREYISASYSNFNITNLLYRLTKDDSKNRIYLGVGVSGRFETVDYVSYRSNPGTAGGVLLDGYQKFRFAPSIKVEYQYDVSKKFFLSTHLLYGFFDEVPHGYWQFALNGGIRF